MMMHNMRLSILLVTLLVLWTGSSEGSFPFVEDRGLAAAAATTTTAATTAAADAAFSRGLRKLEDEHDHAYTEEEEQHHMDEEEDHDQDHMEEEEEHGHDEHTTEEEHDDEHENGEQDHGDHAHGLSLANSFKWAGYFDLEANSMYTLTIQVPSDDENHDDDEHDEQEEDHEGHNHLLRRHLEDEHAGHSEGQASYYDFLLALVPVSQSGQSNGIDEALELLRQIDEKEEDYDHKIQILNQGDLLYPSADHIYEHRFEDAANASLTSSFSVRTNTAAGYVLFLPERPSRVQGQTEQGETIPLLTHDHGDGQPGDPIFVQNGVLLSASLWTDEEESSNDKPWGVVIGSTLLVNIITLTGVIFLVPMLTSAVRHKTLGDTLHAMTSSTVSYSDVFMTSDRRRAVFDICITAFACGALLATTVFLIVPEALILVNSEGGGGGEGGGDSHEGHNHRLLQAEEEEEDAHDDHGSKTWVFGVSLMGGFLFPMFLASFFPHQHQHDLLATPDEREEVEEVEATKEQDDEEYEIQNEVDVDNMTAPADKNNHANVKDRQPKSNIESENTTDIGPSNHSHDEKQRPIVNQRLMTGVLLGDILHNFADGVFIGAAFLLCDHAIGWSVLAGTVYHEVAQEVSDFFLLTQKCYLPPLVALALNFISGLSVTLGGVIVLGMDVSNYAIGVLLSMSAGVYINVAAKECMPIVDTLAVTISDRAMAFFFFVLGAVPIGLVLLNHEHCEA